MLLSTLTYSHPHTHTQTWTYRHVRYENILQNFLQARLHSHLSTNTDALTNISQGHQTKWFILVLVLFMLMSFSNSQRCCSKWGYTERSKARVSLNRCYSSLNTCWCHVHYQHFHIFSLQKIQTLTLFGETDKQPCLNTMEGWTFVNEDLNILKYEIHGIFVVLLSLIKIYWHTATCK